jgi:hypothetical protein
LRALVADFDLNVGPSGQLLRATDLRDRRVQLMVGFDAVL